jgi:hypothetical protein
MQAWVRGFIARKVVRNELAARRRHAMSSDASNTNGYGSMDEFVQHRLHKQHQDQSSAGAAGAAGGNTDTPLLTPWQVERADARQRIIPALHGVGLAGRRLTGGLCALVVLNVACVLAQSVEPLTKRVPWASR